MADPKRSLGEDFLQLAKFATTSFINRPGRGYISLARIGLAIVALGVSVLVPGLWETLLNLLVAKFGTANQQIGLLQIIIAVSLMVLGIALVTVSALLYHAFILRSGPTTKGGGEIRMMVQPKTSFRGLVEAVAQACDMSVSFSGLGGGDVRLRVAPGLLEASDFDDFLKQAASRTEPPLKMTWARAANFYTLQQA